MTQIKLRRDTSANFTSKNPVLGVGEPAYETDTKKLKIGDGTTAYTQLEYFSAGGGDSTDLDKLNVSKMYKTGEISTDTIGYNQLVEMKHSTFDKSKFEVVGNPTITDDGVASGFSKSNYLRINQQFDFSKPFVIKGEFKSGADITTKQFIWATEVGNYTFGIQVFKDSFLYVYFPKADQTGYVKTIKLTQNTEYKYIVSFKNSSLELEINNKKYNIASSLFVPSTTRLISIGVATDGLQAFTGSIDLKQFSITVDSKEVFSGNKTGLDVVKPDNYTVVGNPTISVDGILSSFDSNNKLVKTNNFGTPNKINIEGSFKNLKLGSSTTASIEPLQFNSVNTGSSRLVVLNNGLHWFGMPQNITKSYKLKNGDNIDFKLYLTTSEYGIEWFVNGISLGLLKRTVTLENYIPNIVTIGLAMQEGAPTLDIDLNTIKFYIDGQLVYQPCLKIPYIESKTGSKIVDGVYRDRVIDLYEQEGQAGYYTIDEPNKNFTLPVGEIYGMIGKRSLISSTVTETNRVDIYSDKTCLICGNVATAGTINLPIELASNNYFITLSTSAKTATSFTTTATGDYILIGKVA